VLLVLHPQVRLPADSNNCEQAIQLRTRILIGESFASLRAWFLSSISLTTEGGNLLILLLLASDKFSKVIVTACKQKFFGKTIRNYPIKMHKNQVLITYSCYVKVP
jgi:hypothetical protein